MSLGKSLKPESGKMKMTYLIGALAGGNVVATSIKMVSGILTARLVEPAVLGLFNGIGLVMGYVPFFQLGISNGLNRELPYHIGKNDTERARELAAAAQSWMIIIGIITAVALLVLTGLKLIRGELWSAAGWGTHVILVFLYFYGTCYLQTTYRTSHDFAKLALINVIQAIVALLLLVLVWMMSFYGLCLRGILSIVITTTLLYWWRPLRVGPLWNLRHLKHLFIVGAPIFAVGQIYAWWTVINQTLVLYYTGTHGMGLYTMVTMTTSTIALLPQAMVEVTYPRMAERYGAGGNIDDMFRMALKPMLLCALGMIPLVAAAWWLVEPLVRIVVPKYVEAVPAMKWSLIQPIVMCFAPLNNIFNVMGKQGLFFIAILIGMCSYGGSLLWLFSHGLYLAAFPQAMLIGYTALVVICYIFLFNMKKKDSLLR